MSLLHVPTAALLTLMLLLQPGACCEGGIFGGHKVAPHTRPYMAFIQSKDENNEQHTCGGFLIREDYVMTAAHCQNKKSRVFLGCDNVLAEFEKCHLISVAKMIPHPKYSREHMKHDIMLLKLKHNATLSKHIQPVAMPHPGEAPKSSNCSVAGWGATTQDFSNKSNDLLEVDVPYDASLECNTEIAICTKGPNGPLRGDSGGPLVCGDVAYGVVSTCSKDFQVFTYTRIAHYHHWIKTVLSGHHQPPLNPSAARRKWTGL